MNRTANRQRRANTFAAGLGLALAALAVAGCGDGHVAIAPAAALVGGQRPTGVSFDTSGWSTNFARHSVPLSTIASGGPGRDGIPPLDHPRFVSTAAAAGSLTGGEPVIVVVIAGRARAYPLQILVWHEIVNDSLAGDPIAITYCPLCNTAIVYSRRVAGRLVTFGTTGNLRNSDLVMWDRQTQSWWQQYDGHAIVGSLTGQQLTAIPSETLSFADFRARYPDGEVLSRNSGFARPYGQNPYVGYDATDQRPFLYKGRLDPRLAPLDRVETIPAGTETVVLPFKSLRHHRATEVTVGGVPAVVNFDNQVTSALDARQIRDSREVGTAAAFDRRVAGRTLSFSSGAPGILADLQTGSRWDITGRALSGPLRGAQLHRLRDLQAFWFAVAAFVPNARLIEP
ncbi:MAG: DUF3179 domain-containing protein [Solirubrobacteraceae bacterium]